MSEIDIVIQLRDRATYVCEGSATMCEAPCKLLERAATEIERLRSLAGAVTAGPDLVDLRAIIAKQRALIEDKPKTEYPDWMSMK